MAEDGNPAPETGFTDVRPPAPDRPPPDDPGPDSLTEVIPPTPVSLRPERRGRLGRCRRVVATLTADALWIQDTWQLRHVPLSSVTAIEELRHGKELVLTVGPEPSDRLRLTFAGAEEGRRWHEELQACREELPPDAPPAERPIPEGVALLKQVPEVAHATVGRVEFTAATAWLADRGLQLAAGMRGADAVVGLVRHKCPDVGPGARHASGMAVRVEDAAARQQMRRRWFTEEVSALVRRALLLLAVQAALLLLAGVFCAGMTSLQPTTGETRLELLESMGIALAVICAWPLTLLALLRVLRWPLLLPSVGLAVLAATTGRGLGVVLAHLLAVRLTGSDLEASKVWYLADPVDWALIVIGLVLAVRAWRLAGDARHILPPPAPAVGATPKAWRRGVLALTAAYAVALVGFAGYSRYQMSAEMLRPKFDWPREDERILDEQRDQRLGRLLDEKDRQGVLKCEEAQVKAEKGAAEAEGLYGEAIALWEEILPQANAPDYPRFATTRLAAAYLALAELRQQLGKPREAEAALLKSIEYGEKAVELAPDRPLAKHNLELARQMLDRQREQELLQEIGRLIAAQHYADAADLWVKRIEEQEEALRSGRDREATIRRLAYRLDRFAWFLAHCPDRRVRDTKAAVRHARRATELQPDRGDYWYTLAASQYRNGDWKDSLASLEQVKAKEGEFVAGDWLLLAMNHQQLKQRREAREAFRKADEWIDERKRQAEDNAVLRFQYEMMRPGIEALRREAENLLNGKDPANEGVG